MAANDHSRLGVVHQDTKRNYGASMAYASDPRNWFKRARGEWPPRDTIIHVVDGVDGLTPEMLRVRKPENGDGPT